MNIKETRTAHGFPRVTWTQQMPGGSLVDILFMVFCGAGAVLGALIGFYGFAC